MNYEVYLRSRRLDLELDLEPPLTLRFVSIGFCSADSVERFTPCAFGSAYAFVLRLTGAAAATDGAAASGSTAAFACVAAAFTSDAAATFACAADAFLCAADAFLCAVASLARAFLSSRLASASFCFAAAAAAAAAAASCFAASALVAPDISSSNAFLTAGSTDANLTLGQSKPKRSSLACLNGQNGFGQFGLWFIGVQLQLLIADLYG